MLNILQCTGDSRKQNISHAEVGKPCCHAFLSIGIIYQFTSGTVLTTALLLCARALCTRPTTGGGVIVASWVVSPYYPL